MTVHVTAPILYLSFRNWHIICSGTIFMLNSESIWYRNESTISVNDFREMMMSICSDRYQKIWTQYTSYYVLQLRMSLEIIINTGLSFMYYLPTNELIWEGPKRLFFFYLVISLLNTSSLNYFWCYAFMLRIMLHKGQNF